MESIASGGSRSQPDLEALASRFRAPVVAAGLELYAHTAELLARILTPQDKPLVDEVVRRITAEL